MPAIRVHHTATSDGRFDGPGNEARLGESQTAEYYRSAFAWQDPDGDPQTKAAYKFIHHDVSTDAKVGAANIRACVAGIGVLNGARGGTTIPDADRDGVYRHLAAHIKDAGGTPPELKTMTREAKRLDCNLELKQLTDEGTFTGDLSVYDFVDYGGDVTMKGCFTKSLQESGGKIPLLLHHDLSKQVGVLECKDGDAALEVAGTMNMALPSAQEMQSMMKFNQKHGLKTGLSMGFLTVKDAVQNGIRYLKEVKLLEGSIVTLPMNRLCHVADVKSLDAGGTEAERKDFAQELEAIQVRDLSSQLMNALWCELWDLMYDSDNQADAEDAARVAITAFQAGYLDYIARYFSVFRQQSDMEMMSRKALQLAPRMEKHLRELMTRTQALLEPPRATSTEAGAAAKSGAATDQHEPVIDHSKLKEITKGFFV
jgi:HK97 family phage prohead protease